MDKQSEIMKQKDHSYKIGLVKSEEHRHKLSESMKKHRANNPMIHTPSTIEKIRQSKLGQPSPRKGVILSDEIKKKLSVAALRRWTTEREKKEQYVVCQN